ncbi:hypothetical protein GCM10010922_24940 [Microbacterium sorbitolivorans]|nr:hypothetical protein GCM10010922_24940 [Microbacterium sorbitolivorans]
MFATPEDVAVAVWRPQVADAIGAEPDPQTVLTDPVQGQRGGAHRGDGRPADAERAAVVQVDVDAAVAFRRDAEQAIELAERIPVDRVRARDAVLLALRALVRDAPLRRRLAAVQGPRHAPPALVDVSVRVDEAGQGEQPTAVDPLRRYPRARRHHARDLIAVDQDVCGGSAPGAHVLDHDRYGNLVYQMLRVPCSRDP